MVVDDEGVIGDDRLNKKSSKSKNPAFLSANAKQAFIWLRQAFSKVLILSHFDLERHIRIEKDVFDCTIGNILSQLTSDFD